MGSQYSCLEDRQQCCVSSGRDDGFEEIDIRKRKFPLSHRPTPEDRGKFWVNGIGFIDEDIVTEYLVEDMEKKLKKASIKSKKSQSKMRSVKSMKNIPDTKDEFFPVTPLCSHRVTENEKGNQTGSHAPLGVFCINLHRQPVPEESQGAVESLPTTPKPASVPVPVSVEGMGEDAKPHVENGAENIAGTYDNVYGQFEILGPYGIAYSLHFVVRQENTDGTLTTGRLEKEADGYWRGELMSDNVAFGQISLRTTPSGLCSTFRPFGSSEWGTEMHSVKMS